MVLVIGEILYDLFPDSRRLGGAPFNFAYHLKMLGQDVRFVSRIGQDDLGYRILEFLDVNQFDIKDIQVDPKHPTGTVKITMQKNGSHVFSIVQNTAYDHLVLNDRLKDLARSKWQLFYTGTLIQRTEKNAEVVKWVLENKPNRAASFCDINLRPGCYSGQSIRTSLHQADILKINDEELNAVAASEISETSVDGQVRYLMSTHCLDHLILTRGQKGSRWFAGREVFDSPVPEESRHIKDTVGAGDAYAAMAATGILKGLSPKRIVKLAHEFAGMICEINGAIPEDPVIYQDFKRRLCR